MSDKDDQIFSSTIKNLLKMKPKPHDDGKGEKDKKKGDEAVRRPSASSTSKEDH